MLALACMGKAADMGTSSASTSEIFLEDGPGHKYLGTFNAIQNNGVHWDYWDPANPNKLWGELGVLAGQEGLVSNFLIIVI